MDKTSYEKGMKEGFEKGVKAASQVIKDCERDPKDMTKLSLKVNQRLESLLKCD